MQLKAAADPYYLNPPGSQRGPDKPDSVMPHWEPMSGRYATSFVMAPTNTRIVRKSNAMLGDKYGAQFQPQAARAPEVCVCRDSGLPPCCLDCGVRQHPLLLLQP